MTMCHDLALGIALERVSVRLPPGRPPRGTNCLDRESKRAKRSGKFAKATLLRRFLAQPGCNFGWVVARMGTDAQEDGVQESVLVFGQIGRPTLGTVYLGKYSMWTGVCKTTVLKNWPKLLRFLRPMELK